MICLLKFDFFCFTGVTMQVCLVQLHRSLRGSLISSQLLILVLQHKTAEFYITILAIPVVMVLLIMCGLAVQREIKPCVLPLSVSCIFTRFQAHDCITRPHGCCRDILCLQVCPTLGSEHPGRIQLDTYCAGVLPSVLLSWFSFSTPDFSTVIVAFLLLLFTFFTGIVCFRDFDRGLRAPKVQGTTSFASFSSIRC